MIKQMRKVFVMGAIVAACGVSANTAQAQTSQSCTDAVYGTAGSTYQYSACTANNTANQASTVATSTAVLSTAASQASGLVANRVSSAMGGSSAFNVASNGFAVNSEGMAAGNHKGRFGAWVSGQYSSVEDENTDTAFDGNVYSVMAGIDYKVTPRAIVGLAVGYEDTDIDTDYNRGNLEADGYTIAPYVGYQLTDNASVNLTVGYSDLEYDTDRLDPTSNNAITGSTDSERYFIDASVNGRHNLRGNWNLYGTASVFFASEEKDAYTETESNGQTIAVAEEETDLGVASLEARLGYQYQQVEPYALAGFSYDFTKDEAPVAAGQSTSSLDDEDFGGRFGAGLNFQFAPNVTGSVEAYTVEFRDDYEEYTVNGGLRVKF